MLPLKKGDTVLIRATVISPGNAGKHQWDPRFRALGQSYGDFTATDEAIESVVSYAFEPGDKVQLDTNMFHDVWEVVMVEGNKVVIRDDQGISIREADDLKRVEPELISEAAE